MEKVDVEKFKPALKVIASQGKMTTAQKAALWLLKGELNGEFVPIIMSNYVRVSEHSGKKPPHDLPCWGWEDSGVNIHLYAEYVEAFTSGGHYVILDFAGNLINADNHHGNLTCNFWQGKTWGYLIQQKEEK